MIPPFCADIAGAPPGGWGGAAGEASVQAIKRGQGEGFLGCLRRDEGEGFRLDSRGDEARGERIQFILAISNGSGVLVRLPVMSDNKAISNGNQIGGLYILFS